MPPSLQILTGKNSGDRFELAGDLVVLGRHPDCDVVIDLNAVSRFHAQLVREGSGFAIEDRQSRNGTFVNGRKIEGRVRLADNDRVKICDMLFVYHDDNKLSATSLPDSAPPLAVEEASSTVLKTMDARPAPEMLVKVKPEAKLRAILEISQALGQTLDIDLVFSRILDSLFTIFLHADRGIIITREDNDVLIPKSFKYRRGNDDDVRFSRTIVMRAMSEQQAILSADASSDERFAMSHSLIDFRIRSVMCVPMLTNERKPLGVIQLDTQNQQHRFSEDDLQILASVATQCAVALENAELHDRLVRQARMQRELSIAKDVQAGFLPRHVPARPGYAFWSYYEAAGQVGGDYYDFVQLPDGKQAVVVADVSGKGIPAALLMAKVSSDTKVSLLTTSGDPAAAMSEINNAVCAAGLDDKFITMALCVIDPGRNTLTVVNAGHMSPMVRRGDDRIDEPAAEKATGLPLGVLPNSVYNSVEVPLGLNEPVLIYSDGISEAMNAQHVDYGIERVRKTMLSASRQPVALGEYLLKDVRRHVGHHEQSDDITVVCFARTDP